MRPHFRLFILLAALALGGCYPTSQEAIGISNGPAVDAKLYGVWQGRIANQNGNVYLFFLARAPAPAQAMLVRPGDAPNEKGDWASFSIVLGKAGSNGIVNALFDGGGVPRDENPDFVPLLYRFEADGTLHLYALDTIALEDAVRANRLAGGIVQNGKNADVTLTGDPKTLDAFFAANSAKFFTQLFGSFRRVN